MLFKCAVLFLFFCLMSRNLNATETETRVYVSLNQIEMVANGFLARLDAQNKVVAGKTLSFDENGLYIKEWKGPCWIHDLWCHRCGGCGILLCPMNCSCFD